MRACFAQPGGGDDGYPGVTWALLGPFILLLSCGAAIPSTVLPQVKISYFNNDTARTAEVSSFIDAGTNLIGFFVAPVLGRLSDSIGRKPVLIYATVLMCLPNFCLVFFSATDLMPYFITCGLRGLAGGQFGVSPVITSYVADCYPPEQRSKMFGLVFGFMGCGFALSPILTLTLKGQAGMDTVLFAAGAGTSALALFLLPALSESLMPGSRSPLRKAGGDGGTCGGLCEVVRELNPLRPLLSLFQNRLICVLSAVTLLMNLSENGVMESIFYYLHDKFAFTADDNAYVMLLIGLSSIFVQVFLLKFLLGNGKTRYSKPHEEEEDAMEPEGEAATGCMSEHSVLLLGLGFNICHLLVYALATQRWMIFANMFLAGMTFLAFPATSGILSSALSSHDQGIGLGTLAAVKGLSNVLGPLLFGVVYGDLSGPPYFFPEAMFYIGAAIVSVSIVITVTFLPTAIKNQMLTLQTTAAVAAASYAAVPEQRESGGKLLKVSSSDALRTTTIPGRLGVDAAPLLPGGQGSGQHSQA